MKTRIVYNPRLEKYRIQVEKPYFIFWKEWVWYGWTEHESDAFEFTDLGSAEVAEKNLHMPDRWETVGGSGVS